MKKSSFEVEITGNGLSPETMDWDDLCDIVGGIKAATSSLAEPEGQALPDEVTFSLVAITEGSCRLRIAVAPALLLAASTISDAVRSNKYEDLPRESHEALFRISKKSAARGWRVGFVKSPATKIASAAISPDHQVPQPPPEPLTQGTTTLYGRCLRVGGAKTPRAEIRLTSGDLVNIDVSEAVARELARSLYDEVALEGYATWTQEWRIMSFNVTRITEYRATDPVDAFVRLSGEAKGAWDQVDAEQFVHDLRYGEMT